MSEIIKHEETELATLAPAPQGTDLEGWVSDLGNAYALAEKFVQTPFVPSGFKGKPADAAVAILYGKGLGLDPLASLNAIFLISGRPGLYSKHMHAIVLSAGHEVWVESESPSEVVVKGKRRGSEHEVESRWTIERAQQAGYLSNAKYKSDPISMLKARAIGDVCRIVAPDALTGLAYNEADVALMEPVAESEAPKRTRTFTLEPVETGEEVVS